METATPSLFSNRPLCAELYVALRAKLDGLGAYSVEEKKTSLHVVAGKSAFLGVHPRKDGIRLNIVLARKLEGSRIVKSERVSANRFHNEIDIHQLRDLDDELSSWLLESYVRVTDV